MTTRATDHRRTSRNVALGDEPRDLAAARTWVEAALQVIGYRWDDGQLVSGFHWDTPGPDYVDGHSQPTFGPTQAKAWDRNMGAAYSLLVGEDDAGDPYAFVNDLLPCNCGLLAFEIGDEGQRHLIDGRGCPSVQA